MKFKNLFPICTIAMLMGIVAITGCKKDSDDTNDNNSSGSYYLKFKADGTQKEHKKNVAGYFNKQSPGTNDYSSTAGGTKEEFEDKKNNMVILAIVNGQNTINTTYTNYKTTASGFKKGDFVSLVYFDENGESYVSALNDDVLPHLPPGTEAKAEFTIKEVTSEYVKGNFSGILYNKDYSKKIVITEGDFKVENFH